jgi:hypothetical protein
VSKSRFLVDENLAREAIVSGVKRHDSAIDILSVGDIYSPPTGTLDPEVLEFCAQTQRMLVTDNRHSMPQHVADLFREGRQHWGILKVRKGRKDDIGGIVNSLILIWELEEAGNYLNREEWIPF